MIRQWIILFMGFTESMHVPTGIEKIWGILRQFSRPELCIVTPRTWNEDVEALARFVVRGSAPEALIMLIGYSWGAGVGCMDFARALHEVQLEANDEPERVRPPYDLRIPVACLADPVYRSRLLPKWLPLNLSTMLTMWPVRVPPLIERVEWVYQTMTRPHATGLVAEQSFTGIGDGVSVAAPHTRIDDHQRFHDLCMEEAGKFLQLRRAA